MRKIIQIAYGGEYQDIDLTTALCDDGTVWQIGIFEQGWSKFPGIPQDKKAIFSRSDDKAMEKLKMSNSNGWFEYEKCKPIDSGYYLAYTSYEGNISIEYYDADLGDWLEYSNDNFSHWQPLPKMPEQILELIKAAE